ncbi:uncharacterized protein LOC136024642 [Artemia franciscana]|uniref:Uncharacterized protein n=1 Tax=Artemia franciscana TaxID=6661 RepID=A0AA88HMK6_ARTSF|nr:hypothetical protein QYM36_011092 [Artemia franciscana]
MENSYIVVMENSLIRELATDLQVKSSFKILKRLRRALTILLCFTMVHRLPISNAMPIDYIDEADGDLSASSDDKSAGKWVNPCGTIIFDESAGQTSLKQLMSNIRASVDAALKQLDSFKELFAENVMHSSYDDLVYTLGEVHYRVPKYLITEDTKEKEDVDHFLKDTYLELQEMAVELEQVVIDMAIQGGDFLKNFAYSELKLRSVLCNIHASLIDRNVTPHEDAARKLLVADFRNKENSYRDLRDFLFLKDYYNSLQHIHEVSEYWRLKSV